MSIEEQPFATVIVQLFKDKGSLDIHSNYGKGLPLNPWRYVEYRCFECSEGFPHDECDRSSLDHPEYSFGIGPKHGNYGAFTWTPDTFKLVRAGAFYIDRSGKTYDATTPVKKVLKDIKKMCIASGPQYSDEDRFPADAFVVIPRVLSE